MLIEAYNKPLKIMIYTDNAVSMDHSWWGSIVKQDGRTVQESSVTYRVTTIKSDHANTCSHSCSTLAVVP